MDKESELSACPVVSFVPQLSVSQIVHGIKAHVQALTIETRTGSRRIKAIPKRPAGVATAG